MSRPKSAIRLLFVLTVLVMPILLAAPHPVHGLPTGASGSFNDQSWNQHAVFPSTASITNSVLYTTVANIAAAFTGSYYAVGLFGTADWSPPGPAIPGPYLSLDGTFTSLSIASGWDTDFKVETTLYYYFQSPQSGTSCNQWRTNMSWLDIQIQFSNYDSQTGGYQQLGSYVGCAGPKSISYRETIATTLPGQDFAISNLDITALYQRALTAQHLPSTVSASLVGVEAGVEGYNLNVLSASYRHFTIGPAILSNNPRDPDWIILGGNWTQPDGKLQGKGYWPEMASTTIFSADRTISISARTIVTGPNNWDTAWVRAKYVDENNKITMFLRKDKYLEIDVKKSGSFHYYVSRYSTGQLPGDWHTFKIVFSNNNIKGYVDGTIYLDITDPMFGTFYESRILLTSSGTSVSQFDSTTIS